MRVGGAVEWLLEPKSPHELHAAYSAALERGFVPRLLGGGANVIVAEGLLPGVVIATDCMRRLFRSSAAPMEAMDVELSPKAHIDDTSEPVLVAWSGASLPHLVRTAQRLGWSGMEGLVGIPGNVGGGIAMNAGGRWGEIFDCVACVRAIQGPEGETRDLGRSALQPRYRDGGLAGSVVVAAVFVLTRDDPEAVRERSREYLLEKQRAQPLTEHSCGCIFKNPDRAASEGRSAGELIEQSGGKGLSRGGARVSEKHANFIVHRGDTNAGEVLALVEAVRSQVADRTGIWLETEVKIWDSPGN
jgi:UDP-N-acetylmuramate dehydrogenase